MATLSRLFLFFLCCAPIARADDFVDIQQKALRFFLENTHPRTGLVRDNAHNFSATPASNTLASIAATGFGLAVVSHASTVGMIPSDQAYQYDLRALRFAKNSLVRRNGWFLHFVDWSSGRRVWNSEFSTIDTALFFCGALYAAQVFPNSEVAELANSLFAEVDYHDYLTDGGTKPAKLTLSLSYTPEKGYSPYQWEVYAEQLAMLVLGLGHPTHPLPPEAWRAWKRQGAMVADLGSIVGYDMPLFTHQYSQLFVDFRGHLDGGIDYFENGKRASLLHRQLASKDGGYRTLEEGFWGFSAGDSKSGYKVYGPFNYEGTVCVGCAVASAMYLPSELHTDIANWRSRSYGDKLWGKYGFTDSINVDQNWFSTRVFAITKGPEYLAIANTHGNTSIWKLFGQIPAVRRGLSIIDTLYLLDRLGDTDL